jgi:Tfp pilus assembly protein PilF
LWVEWAYVDLDRQRPLQALDKLARALALDPAREDATSLRAAITRALTRDGTVARPQ